MQSALVISKWKRHLAHDMPFYKLNSRAFSKTVNENGCSLSMTSVWVRVCVWSGVDVVSFVRFFFQRRSATRTNLIFKFNTTHAPMSLVSATSKWISFRSSRWRILLLWFLCKIKADHCVCFVDFTFFTLQNSNAVNSSENQTRRRSPSPPPSPSSLPWPNKERRIRKFHRK